MFGRKDKKAERGKGREKKGSGGDLAAMFGLNMEMPDESELEAELMAMEGGSNRNSASGGKKKGPMSVDEINKMVAGVESIGEDDNISDLSDIDEDELLGELQALENNRTPEPAAQPTPQPKPSPRQPVKTSGSVGVVSERLDVYKRAVSEAEAAGESSKAKRYKRGLTSLQQLLKSAQAGKTVSEDDLPPMVAFKGPSKQPTAAAAKKPPSNLIDLNGPEFDEFTMSEEELAAMSGSIVDDIQTTKPTTSPRQQAPPPPSKPSPSPRQQAPPPLKPSPSPASKPVVSPRQQAPPPMKADGMIDLDAPEFNEFTLSEDDLAAMTAAFVDDRKKPKLDDSLTTPTVAMETKQPSQSLPARVAPRPVSDKDSVRSVLNERRDQYLSASKTNKSKEREYKIVAARFAKVLKAFDRGEEVDLSQMPGPPPGFKSSYTIDTSQYTPSKQQQPAQSPAPSLTPSQASLSPSQTSLSGQSPNTSLSAGSEAGDVNSDIPTPKTTMEALQQRLAKYQEGVKTAHEKGESSRVRRMGRIVKSYEDAIKATKAGKPFDYDELPAPPGYPPIPLPKGVDRPRPQPPTQSLPVAMVTKTRGPSLNAQQVQLVEQRRTELLTAAKQEQSKGNKEQALYYLKLKKGLDRMLEAARSGLPVNLEEVPPSPFADLTQTQPSKNILAHLQPAKPTDGATFDLIEKQLAKQIEICDTNADTYRRMGSTPASLQYENMSQNCQRELLAIKGIRTQGLGPPKFTLETRKFTVVNTHTELSSGVCEIEVIRGVNIPKPSGYEEKDLNLYVEVEFPWPADSPPKDSTETVKHTCSPEFKGQSVKFEIDRKKTKGMARAFKRTPVKCGVWQKRTFKRDTFIGVAQLNVEGLESKSEVNAVCDLMDEKGRRPVGGKLEVLARLREPLTGTDKEEREEQWIVFQEAIAAKSAVSMPKPPAASAPKGQGSMNFALLSPVKVESMISLEALKFEFGLVQTAMKSGHKDKATATRGKMVHDRSEAIKQRLQTDSSFLQSYSKLVAKEMASEQQLEAQLTKQGKGKSAMVILQKRRAAMEKELKELKSRKM